jgi:hypothetical protein
VSALQNVYKDDEEREEVPKVELVEDELTEDFTAILMAMLLIYQGLSDESEDIVGFTHILNRLAIQSIMADKKGGAVNGTE